MALQVSEIYSSIQGEGKYTGYPTTIVRLHGCNFKCRYCDEPQAKIGDSKKMSIERVMSAIHRLRNKHVCITGGEPLLQEETITLVYELNTFAYIVSIETSGLVPLDRDTYTRSFSYCMDVKCPCSGESAKNCYKNLDVLRCNDEVKFVVRDERDIEFVKNTLKKYPTKAAVILSPLNNDEKSCEIILNALTNHKIDGRIGLQMHKVLNIK